MQFKGFLLFILLSNFNVFQSISYQPIVNVEINNCYNETCFLIDDVSNSPLVECSYL